MLDNKHLTEQQKEGLRFVPYDQQIKIYDKMCANCPFQLIQTKQNNLILTHSSIIEAIGVVLNDKDTQLLRGCYYGDEEYTLTEIIQNTCRLWSRKTRETGIDNPDNDERSFMEIIADERRSVRESRVDKIISQLESAKKVST